jgi:hypothetical protein
VRLITAAAPDTAGGGPSDDAIRVSALKGDWSTLGQFAPTAEEVKGLAHAFDAAVLYGVVPTAADDSIVTIDPSTGSILATVGTIANGGDEIISMAYDPGATSATSDDRLLVLEVTSSGSSGEFRAIDPASPSTATLLGSITLSPASGLRGLAYDATQQKLFASSNFGPDGLYEIDLSSCPPSPCSLTQVPGAGLFRSNSSLAFSPVSGNLYLAGTAFSGSRTFYDSIDTTTFESEAVSLDQFTPAALAAVPEPSGTMGLMAGVSALAALTWLRRRGG